MSRLSLLLLFVLLVMFFIGKLSGEESQNTFQKKEKPPAPSFVVHNSFEEAVLAGGGFYHLADPSFPYPGATYVVPVKAKLSKQKEKGIVNAIIYKVRGYWQSNEPMTMIQEYYNSGNKRYLIFMVNPIACS